MIGLRRFIYPLAALVRLTTHERDTALLQSMTAQQNARASQADLQRLVADVEPSTKSGSNGPGARIETDGALRRVRYHARLFERIVAARDAAHHCDEMASAARSRVGEAHRRLVALCRHRDAATERNRAAVMSWAAREADAAWLARSQPALDAAPANAVRRRPR